MSDEVEEEEKKKRGKRQHRVALLPTSTLWLYFLGTAVTTFILLFSFHRTVLVFMRGMETSSPSVTVSPVVSSPSPSSAAVATESREEAQLHPKISNKSLKPPPIVNTIPNKANPPTSSFTSDQVEALRKKRIENMIKHTGVTSLSEHSATAASSTTPSHEVDRSNSAGKVSTVELKPQSVVSAASSGKTLPSIIDSLIQCPSDMVQQYDQVPNASKDGEDNLTWCQRMKSQHNVVIGRSWGSLGRSEKLSWDSKKCNELISLGKVQTCAERWGWKWFDNWSKKKYEAYEGGSNVTCIADVKTTTFCEMENIVMDFGKMSISGQSRMFDSGFISLYGSKGPEYGRIPPYPGLRHLGNRMIPTVENKQCDEYESRPTFILSNDDIYNLGHYMNDVMGIWNMFTLANRSPKDSLLINIDGVRAGGPAGGPAHRVMEASRPDHHGPYSEFYYHRWFSQVKKGVEYENKKVCFKELYVFPLPGVPWFWNNWGIVDECSMVSQSPLYQSFNVFLRQKLMDHLGKDILPLPPTDEIHVVIEVRKINPRKGNNHATSRYIKNLRELISALTSIPNVKVTAQNFAELNFLQQIQLAHSASIFLSMHGAGTTHIFHAALGAKNCCGFVEMFPDETIDLHTAYGYGNLGRMLGFHHYRYVASRGSTKSDGTVVDVGMIKGMVEDAIEKISTKPTCLLDVKDTRFAIYGQVDGSFH